MRLSYNLEMGGDPEATSSAFQPGREAPGSTLEGGPCWRLSTAPQGHVSERQFQHVSVV